MFNIRQEVEGSRIESRDLRRVSTDDKGKDPLNQLLELREFAAWQGRTVVWEYTDDDFAKNGERTGFKAMRTDVARHPFDLLLFWPRDRFSRESVLETLQHLQRLTSYGVAFKSFTEQYLDGTGLFRDAIIGILAALAHQERVRLSERVVAGLERARAQGRVGGRPRVKRERDRDASRIQRMRDEGQSYADIADELGRSKSDIHRVCQTLGCSPAAHTESVILL
jgi:DNA invertase Pin-like site-specific DNA recombinase